MTHTLIPALRHDREEECENLVDNAKADEQAAVVGMDTSPRIFPKLKEKIFPRIFPVISWHAPVFATYFS